MNAQGKTLLNAAMKYLGNKDNRVEARKKLRSAIKTMRRGSGNTQTGKTSERAASAILKTIKLALC